MAAMGYIELQHFAQGGSRHSKNDLGNELYVLNFKKEHLIS